MRVFKHLFTFGGLIPVLFGVPDGLERRAAVRAERPRSRGVGAPPVVAPSASALAGHHSAGRHFLVWDEDRGEAERWARELREADPSER
jgi:hypothetical protein